MIGIHEIRKATEMMKKSFATWASEEICLRLLICFIVQSNLFPNAKPCLTALKILI